jgi:hypothetical protein
MHLVVKYEKEQNIIRITNLCRLDFIFCPCDDNCPIIADGVVLAQDNRDINIYVCKILVFKIIVLFSVLDYLIWGLLPLNYMSNF